MTAALALLVLAILRAGKPSQGNTCRLTRESQDRKGAGLWDIKARVRAKLKPNSPALEAKGKRALQEDACC